ncbi:MAG TPA: hypothetical protein PLP42_16780 [Acidobacteriota bacterium]|nr:hypothetical protein [Acidobacteriota bacterium]
MFSFPKGPDACILFGLAQPAVGLSTDYRGFNDRIRMPDYSVRLPDPASGQPGSIRRQFESTGKAGLPIPIASRQLAVEAGR